MNGPGANGRPLALVYASRPEAEATLRLLASGLAADGRRVAGLLAREVARPGRSRCDMVLEEPASGARIRISRDRGEHARGCRLDVEALLAAGQVLRGALEASPDVVLLNKFGKAECEGGGLRDVIAEVVMSGTPLVIGVPADNLAGWRAFAGDEADDVPVQGPVPETVAAVRALLAL